MRNSTNLENPITQYSPLKQALQPHLGVLPSTFDIALKPTPQFQSMCMVRSPKIDRWSSRSHIRERTLQLITFSA